MNRSHYSLKTLFVTMAAISVWLFVVLFVGNSHVWGGSSKGYSIALISLAGATGAIRWLLTARQSAWAWSALTAGVIIAVAILIVAGIAQMS